MTPVSAHDIAAELRRRLPGLGAKKLHKLLYYSQGHHLATFGTPLFTETVFAWDMGPVVGTLWHQEKAGPPPETTSELSEAALNTVGYVLSRYGALTGSDLERLTHSEPPWLQANLRRSPGTAAKIPHESLIAFFANDSSDDGDDETPLPDVDAVSAWLADVAPPTVTPPPDSADRLRARLRA
jgi:uncharacterized phage-associated protein